MGYGAKIANGILNSKLCRYLTDPKAPDTAARIALVSNVSKDALNCYYYVRQSLANERIPEEKRKFVASLDFTNGILNVLLQFGLGNAIIDMSNKVFDTKLAPKYFSKNAVQKMFNKIKPDTPFSAFCEKMSKNKKLAKTGLSVIATLVATQVIAKRILVPLISTPMASFLKKKYEEKQQNKANYDDNVSFSNKTAGAKINHENLPTCFKSFMQ